MKKIISILLALCLLVTLSGCILNDANSTEKESSNAAQQQEDLSNASACKACLYIAFEATSYAADKIYNSCYFSIYLTSKFNNSDWSSTYQAYIDDYYPQYLGINYSSVKQAFESEFGYEYTPFTAHVALENVTLSVQLIMRVMKDSGLIDSLDNAMQKSKDALVSVDQNGPYYADLLAYYTEMKSYLDFVKNPSGSFNQLGNTISNYEKNIQNYDNKLSVYLD